MTQARCNVCGQLFRFGDGVPKPNCSKRDYFATCEPEEVQIQAPPRGVEPAWAWHERRIRELSEAVQRQFAPGVCPKMEQVAEWLAEAAELAKKPHPSKPTEAR